MTVRRSLHQYFRDVWLNSIGASYVVPRTGRYLIYRAWGIELGSRNIMAGCFVSGTNLRVGRKCFINYGCFFDATAPIEISDGCHIGMQALICTSTHDTGDASQRAATLRSEPVTIGRGVWLGARVTVMPGVSIGDGCIVAANSLVKDNCAPNGLYAGTPARRVRDLEVSAAISA